MPGTRVMNRVTAARSTSRLFKSFVLDSSFIQHSGHYDSCTCRRAGLHCSVCTAEWPGDRLK